MACKLLAPSFQTFHVQTEGIMSISELNFHLKIENRSENHFVPFLSKKSNNYIRKMFLSSKDLTGAISIGPNKALSINPGCKVLFQIGCFV